jgi:arginase
MSYMTLETFRSRLEKASGGSVDHAITYPIVKALRGKYDRLNILHFDAHPDLYHDFEGNPNSHASPFARVMENCLADRLVQVGIRTTTGHQREQAARFHVEVIEMRDVVDGMTVALDRPVYVSVDMDGFDPAYAPGVSHPEPGGLTPRQVIGMIQALEGKIVGADVVEVNPIRDHNNLTGALAAKLVKELAAAMISR